MSTSNTEKNEAEFGFRIKQYLQKFFHDVIDLEEGVDKRATIKEIRDKISMSGANAWMLMCSIVIASIGLDLNSAAVIIGAMLISPLMSPILGIGLAVGINDKDTLNKSLAHFGMAVLIAIIVSTIYFYFSPIQQLTSQIKARTEPTVLDILIAFFGGIAGIISNARKDLSTTLPGVAIATALMPPLCVTGFGIANGNWLIASNSFYLFFLNTFFVSMATYVIVKWLRFPLRKYINKRDRRRNMIVVGIFSALATIPSVLIFGRVIERVRNQQHVETFINETIGNDKVYIDQYELKEIGDSYKLVMKVYGNVIGRDKSSEYEAKLAELGLENTVVDIIPTSEISMEHLDRLETQIDGVEHMTKQLEVIRKEKEAQDLALKNLETSIANSQLDSTKFNSLCLELASINPEIDEVTYALGQQNDFTSYVKQQPLFVIKWKNKTPSRKKNEKNIQDFLKARLQKDGIRVIFTN